MLVLYILPPRVLKIQFLTATAVGNMGAVAGAFAPKDILQLRSDIEKLRTHQSFLDHIYTELKDYVSIREKKAEEAYRRSVGKYSNKVLVLYNLFTHIVYVVAVTGNSVQGGSM